MRRGYFLFSSRSDEKKAIMKLRFGTMGWAYDDWRGVFYTADLPAAKLLAEYSKVFSAVELDTTFYGAPRPTTINGWAAQVPDDFRFTAKFPRAITHERRLRGADEAARDFGNLMRDHLGAKLGGLLLQLPPDFSAEERNVLATFLDGVTAARHGDLLPLVVELRAADWAETDIAATLAERGLRAAITERLDTGASLSYIRLLGEENAVARFNERQFDRAAELDDWASRLKAATTASPASEIFVFARNFYEGHAPATLFELMRRLNIPVPTPPGQQQMSLF